MDIAISIIKWVVIILTVTTVASLVIYVLIRLRALRRARAPHRAAAPPAAPAGPAAEASPASHAAPAHDDEHEGVRTFGTPLQWGPAAAILLGLGWYLFFGIPQWVSSLLPSGLSSGSSTSASNDCPSKPKLLSVGPAWVPVNPDHPDAICDFSVALLDGQIETDGPAGGYIPTPGAIGRTGTKVVTKVKAAGDKAMISFFLCESGKGPDDGSGKCKP